jgi:hypothetical protein
MCSAITASKNYDEAPLNVTVINRLDVRRICVNRRSYRILSLNRYMAGHVFFRDSTADEGI